MAEVENPDDKHDDPNLEAIYGDIMDDFEAVDPNPVKDPHDEQDPHVGHDLKELHEDEAT